MTVTEVACGWEARVTRVPLAASASAAFIDRPSPDDSGPGLCFTLAGWVIGATSPAREVHVLFDGALVRRVEVAVERADVAAAHPGAPGGARVGFRMHVGLLGLPSTASLDVVAMLEDGTPVHLATIVVAHRSITTGYEPRLSPITVTSLGRMGTTWLMRLLAHHPEIVVHPQYPYEVGVAKYWAHLVRVASAPADHTGSAHPETFTAESARIGHNPYFGDFLAASPDLNRWLGERQPALLAAYAQQASDEFYLAVAARTGNPAPRCFAEKGLPDHIPDVLADVYPRAREVILVRDIRDVICSAVAFDAKRGRRSFGREVLADDLGFVNQLHMDLGRLVRSWQRRRDDALLVRYESLVAAPEATLAQILGHLDLASSPAIVTEVLAAANATTPELDAHRTTSDAAASIGRWRTDLAAVHPDLPERCEELFAPLLTELGYPVVPSRARAMRRDLVDVLARLDA